MTRLTTLHPALAAAALLAGSAYAQGALAQGALAARVTAAPDGEVRLAYATRTGACGDGRDVVALGHALYVHSSMESFGRWSGVQCTPGAARVALTVRAHRVEGIRTHVGGAWPTASGAVTDLGAVRAADAAAYFLDLAGRVDGRDARNAILPAVIADSADVVPGLVRLAADTARPRTTRRRAVQWAGQLGGAALVPTLERFAKADDGDDAVAEAALFALSALRDGAGVPSLIACSRSAANARLQEKAAFWLAQADDPRAEPAVRALIEDAAQPERVRGAAIFALSQTDQNAAARDEYLHGLYGRVGSAALQEKIMQAVGQHESRDGARWLLGVAADTAATTRVRKQALFWAGQGAAESVDLARFYDRVADRDVKEHAVFVLSQRDDEASTAKLLAVARDDGDREMRRKALFWLTQKHDPRVTQMITDIVTHD